MNGIWEMPPLRVRPLRSPRVDRNKLQYMSKILHDLSIACNIKLRIIPFRIAFKEYGGVLINKLSAPFIYDHVNTHNV